jgi:SAM-dependent methyltransferase
LFVAFNAFAQDSGSGTSAPAAPATAETPPPDKPKIVEETPYVTSPQKVVEAMLRMAGVRSDDFLMDLGSGDGRIVVTAASEYKTRGVGIEYDPRLVKLAIKNAATAGVTDRATFLEQDIFKSDFSQASVITIYLIPSVNEVLQPRLLALKPGTRIVSHDYGIGDWEPDAKEVISVPEKKIGVKKESAILFWVVPARLAGHWTTSVHTLRGTEAIDIDIRQKNQYFEGTARLRGRELPIEQPYINGTYVTFRIGEGDDALQFIGHESNGHIKGLVVLSNNRHMVWNAHKGLGPKS